MNLHRSSAQPDWSLLEPSRRNGWQRLAARTNGIITPGNIFTMAGLLLVLIGLGCILHHAYWWGLALVAIGRLCDILDGLAAEATGTKSPLGEALDAIADKVGSILTFGALVFTDVISVAIAVILLLPNLSSIGLTFWARFRGTPLHPAQSGKLSMALSWVALACFLLVASLELSPQSWLMAAGDACAFAALALGVIAAHTYLRALRSAGL